MTHVTSGVINTPFSYFQVSRQTDLAAKELLRPCSICGGDLRRAGRIVHTLTLTKEEFVGKTTVNDTGLQQLDEVYLIVCEKCIGRVFQSHILGGKR